MSQRQTQQRRTQRRGNNSNNNSFFRIFCSPCDSVAESCATSVIFLGFVAFYLLSFLWDIFTILGAYSTLSLSQLPNCVNRTEYFNITPVLILTLLFIATFHAIALVWIIGFIHSKNITNAFYDGIQLVDVPNEYCSPTICIPFLCFDVLMIIQFGLSFYVYLFLSQLIEEEPEDYIDKFCIGYDETEMAYLWMQISLYFFLMTLVMGCVYCCLIRIATNDISVIQQGQQQFIITSPRYAEPQSNRQQQQQQQREQRQPLNNNNNNNNNRNYPAVRSPVSDSSRNDYNQRPPASRSVNNNDYPQNRPPPRGYNNNNRPPQNRNQRGQ